MSADGSLVVDLGNSTFKAGYVFGFPNDDEPRLVTPAAVRQLPGPATQTATPPSTDAHQSSEEGQLIHPLRQGVIQSWDALETLLHYTLYEQLGWVEGEESNLLLGEPILTSRTDREQMAALMFETFNVAGYFVSDQAVLSLYSVGKLSGTVVDIGANTIDIGPVTDGLLHLSTSHRLPYGGDDLTKYLIKILANRGVKLPEGSAAEELKVKSLQALEPGASSEGKEGGMGGGTGDGVAGGSKSEEGGQPKEGEGPTTHTLPDGQTITVKKEDGEQLIGALLNPSVQGLQWYPQAQPLAEVVVTAGVYHPEKDVRKGLMEHILVCGGGSGGVAAVGRRLLAEVRSATPPPLQPALCSAPPYMPGGCTKYASWMGGAILAKVVFGGGQHVTKADYDESGPLVIHKKCS